MDRFQFSSGAMKALFDIAFGCEKGCHADTIHMCRTAISVLYLNTWRHISSFHLNVRVLFHYARGEKDD